MMDPVEKFQEIVEAATQPAKLETTPLPYSFKELEPIIDRDSLEFHYEKLAKGYAKRYNAGEGNADFNRAGSFLHNKFFPQLQPPKGLNRPKGAVLELIESKFKTYEDFQEKFMEAALSLQGSGWIYLSTTGEIKTIRNHSVRTDICVLLDMWEHSYLPQYRESKEKYVQAFWRIVNWNVCSERI